VGSIDQGTSKIASRSADSETIASLLTGRRFARVPVFEGDPENVIGYVALKDLLLPAIRGETALLAQVREMTFVPSSMSASSLLRQMQRERAPIVMVTDENGGLRGLVTIEDLVEELVGDILSEGDPPPVVLGREADGSAVVPGSTPIRDVNRALGLDLPEPDGVSTIAGLCIRAAGHLPRAGERIVLADGHAFDVLDATPRHVRSVRVIPPGDRGLATESIP
jgi:putative hemolysin